MSIRAPSPAFRPRVTVSREVEPARRVTTIAGPGCSIPYVTISRSIRAGLAVALLSLAPAAVARAEAAVSGAKLHGLVTGTLPSQSEFERMAAGGARTIRVPFYWQRIEPSPGARDWSTYDTLIRWSTEAGIRLLPHFVNSPDWISPVATRPPLYGAGKRAAWSRFAEDAAARYGRGGDFWDENPDLPHRPIRIWQLWNEVNLPYFWGGKPSARRYVQLLRITRRSLRRGDPKALVMTAGLFRYQTVPFSIAARRYLRRLYSIRGARRWFDIVALHPYSPRPRGVLSELRAVRAIMDRHGDRRTPLWATEFGWTVGGAEFRRSRFRATRTQQARRLAWTYRLLGQNAGRLRLRGALWHSWIDFPTSGPDHWIGRMGLFRMDGVARPAWYRFARGAGGTP